MILEVIKKALYALYPRRCPCCAEVVALDVDLCDDCKCNKRILGEICTVCGKDKSKCSCPTKNTRKPDYDSIVAPYYYDSNIKKAVHRFKFSGYRELSEYMGTQMAHCVNDRYSDINFDVVTFVPLTRKRKRSRGYNQSQLLANQISKTLDIPCKTLLKKVVSNRPQRSMRGNERRGNVFGVYDIVPNVDVTGKTILIVDDVKTTGSTVGECCATLKAYGANKVYAVTFAIR